jgi:hypothetical protein
MTLADNHNDHMAVAFVEIVAICPEYQARNEYILNR